MVAWKGRTARKGDVVQFLLDSGERVVGIYLSADDNHYYLTNMAETDGERSLVRPSRQNRVPKSLVHKKEVLKRGSHL